MTRYFRVHRPGRKFILAAGDLSRGISKYRSPVQPDIDASRFLLLPRKEDRDRDRDRCLRFRECKARALHPRHDLPPGYHADTEKGVRIIIVVHQRDITIRNTGLPRTGGDRDFFPVAYTRYDGREEVDARSYAKLLCNLDLSASLK